MEMTFSEFIDYIKKYLNEEQTDCEYCDDFYAKMNVFDIEFDKNNYDYEFNIYCEILDIEEQVEPWTKIEYFKEIDDQLRLLKNIIYNLRQYEYCSFTYNNYFILTVEAQQSYYFEFLKKMIIKLLLKRRKRTLKRLKYEL